MALNIGPDGKLIIETKEAVEQSKEKKPLFNIFKKKEQVQTDTEVLNTIMSQDVNKPVLSESNDSQDNPTNEKFKQLVEENERLKHILNTEHTETDPCISMPQEDNSTMSKDITPEECVGCDLYSDDGCKRYESDYDEEPEVTDESVMSDIPVYDITLHSKSRRDYSVSVNGEDNLRFMLDELARCKMSINPEDKLITIGKLSVDLRDIEGWTLGD